MTKTRRVQSRFVRLQSGDTILGLVVTALPPVFFLKPVTVVNWLADGRIVTSSERGYSYWAYANPDKIKYLVERKVAVATAKEVAA